MKFFAIYVNIYGAFLFRILRLGLFVYLLWIIAVDVSANISPTIPFACYFILLMAEIFFHFKVLRKNPSKQLSEVDTATFLDACTLQAARTLLSGKDVKTILRAVYKSPSVRFFLQKASLTPASIQIVEVKKELLLQYIFTEAKKSGFSEITSVDVFAAYLLLTEEQTKILFEKSIKIEELRVIQRLARQHALRVEIHQPTRVNFVGSGIGETFVSGWKLEVKKYTGDFTKQIIAKNPQLVGREKELSKLLEILRKTKSQNVLLVGNPGVGKKTIVEMLAKHLFAGRDGSHLRHRRIVELFPDALLAGADNVGMLSERIKNVFYEIEHEGNIIVFIPEMQTITGGGGMGFDASGALLQVLQSEHIQIIGTVTPENYRMFLEKKSSFVEHFESIDVSEPTDEETTSILAVVASVLEAKHRVTVPYETIQTAVVLSKRYIANRYLPAKAIDLLDAACVRAQGTKNPFVTSDVVTTLVEEKTHAVIGGPTTTEKDVLLHLEEQLHKRVIGQEEAVRTVSEALRRGRSGMGSTSHPVGVFLFLGPTGVGKTELAKALATVYYGGEEHMVRLDMGTYKDAQSLSRLIGSAPGQGEDAGQLSLAVRAQPSSLVLLDELEKANSNILDVFLSVFDDGKLIDAKGHQVSFTDAIIIATSNAGSELIREKIQAGLTHDQLKTLLIENLQKQGLFKPEFLNRFDAVVVFEPLTGENVQQIVQLMLTKVSKKAKEQDVVVVFDEGVIEKIAKEGFDKEFGARPLRRFIQDNIEDQIAQKLLSGEVKRGNTIHVRLDAGQNIQLIVG